MCVQRKTVDSYLNINTHHSLEFVLMQNVANTARAFLRSATRCDAQLFTRCILLTFPVLWTILLVLAARAVELAVANVLLIDTNVGVRHILVRRTSKLPDFTLNWTIALVVCTLAIHKSIA